MDDYTYETITTEDGNHRARVVLDQYGYDMKPDGDCYGTVIYQEGGYYRSSVNVWCERYQSTDNIAGDYASIWDDLRDLDQVEAVLRGKANVCEECGEHLWYVEGEQAAKELCPSRDEDNDQGWHVERYDFSDNPIVGFDVTELRDGRLVNIVTLADLNTWGWESVEAFRKALGDDVDPSAGNLADFEAYANGDVYFVTVESKVIERTEIRTLNTRELVREVEVESWETHDFDTVHGFYGTEHAIETAKEFIKDIETAEVAA